MKNRDGGFDSRSLPPMVSIKRWKVSQKANDRDLHFRKNEKFQDPLNPVDPVRREKNLATEVTEITEKDRRLWNAEGADCADKS